VLAKLIFASGEDADMAYATGFDCPDPFALILHRGKKTILLSDLEVDRGRASARADEVLALSGLEKKFRIAPTIRNKATAVLAAFLISRKIHRIEVPSIFPLGLADGLRASGIEVTACDGFLFPEREFKSAIELGQLTKAARITEAAITRGLEVLRASEIGKRNQLMWGGRALTSELLRAEIDSTALRMGGLCRGTIVAGGNQACDPHERGHGPLRAHELIIIDVFPQDTATGYFGDLTRTVVRGKATDAQSQLWHTVMEARQLAIRQMKPGIDGGAIHASVKQYFTDQGYHTEQKNGRWQGFFHGTGHGLGLELHEAPRMSTARLAPGHVLTVEPGLYYPGIGGVRHEDVVAVTASGHRKLSKLPHFLGI